LTSPSHPIFVIEENGKTPYLFRVCYDKTDFVNWFILPPKKTFQRGTMFDATGNIFFYEANDLPILFDGRLYSILNNLILPSLVYKFLSFVISFAPRTKVGNYVELNKFKATILDRLAQYENKSDVLALQQLFDEKGDTYVSVINCIFQWINEG